jgi:competence protein ComGF
MEFQKNEHGFTFYSLLFTLAVIIMCIPLYGAIIKTIKDNSYYDEISIQQVFYFIQQDVIQAINYHVEDKKIYLTLIDGDTVTIEQYGDVVRRQVDGKGHEIYLRDIQDFHVRSLDYGFKLSITSFEGEHYEKTITFYPS